MTKNIIIDAISAALNEDEIKNAELIHLQIFESCYDKFRNNNTKINIAIEIKKPLYIKEITNE